MLQTHSKIRATAVLSKKPNLRLNNMPMATPSLGPFTAPMPHFENQAFNPFFSNIRQNMELSHGPIRERFPIRLPIQHPDPKDGPEWLRNTLGEQGAQYLAETYEKLERTEQRRLQNIMHFHSKHTDNASDFPFSIVAGIEMGALNRYTNIWPFGKFIRLCTSEAFFTHTHFLYRIHTSQDQETTNIKLYQCQLCTIY